MLIHGRSRADFAIETMDVLGGHEAVSTVLCGAQNHLYVGAFLKRIDHLDAVVTFVKEAGQIPEPEALIFNTSSDVTCVRNRGMLGRLIDESRSHHLGCRERPPPLPKWPPMSGCRQNQHPAGEDDLKD